MEPGSALADLIGKIYEAGAFPERWPAALHEISGATGAVGGNMIRNALGRFHIQSSPGIEKATQAFAREGWNERNSRVERLLARADHGGFLTDSDLHSEDELGSLPMYTEFLNPWGVAAGAATIVQGARNDALIVAIEGFPTHAASRKVSPVLDALRPHLARAVVLSSEIQSSRVKTLIEAFGAIGTAIGLLARGGRLVAATGQFQSCFETILVDGPGRLKTVDDLSDSRLAAALADLEQFGHGRSVALRDQDKVGAAVLHLVPARFDARDLFNDVIAFAILSPPGNALLPQSDIIAALFDLTPAEARVARGIALGLSPARVSEELGVTAGTVRSQLKRVYAKTSTRRQAELAALVSKLI